MYVECLDCACHTAELPFNNELEKLESAKQVATLWNIGKVIYSRVGD